MKQSNLKTGLIVSLLCISSFSVSAQAATGVGKAIISIGKVFTTSKDGKEKKLKRRGKVFEGDTINVGKKSRLQLRFIDNQLVVLKENTVFRIDEYKFKDKNDNNKSAALSLLKGGMRSVTGLIGKSARDKYKVKTPVATMGVRGTHYLLQVCSGDCGDGVKGLVGTVLEGEIEMKNEGGTSTFGTDQFFNVPSSNEAPRTMTNPPSTLVSKAEIESDDEDSEESNDEGGDEGEETVASDDSGDAPADDTTSDTGTTDDGSTTTDTTFTSGEQTTVETTTGTVATTTDFYTGTLAPTGALMAFSGIMDEIEGAGGIAGVQGTNADANLETVNGVGNQLVNTSITDAFGTASFQVKTGAVASDQGGDPALGINWGRWNAADVEVIDQTGASKTLLTGLNFIYSDNPTPDSFITSLITSQAGLYTFGLVNGPAILDESGGIASASLFIDIDFGVTTTGVGQVVDFYGAINGADGRVYDTFMLTSFVDLVDLKAGSELQITGVCSGAGACATAVPLTGSAGGGFVGSNAEALIGYFGLNDASGTIGVSGVGEFANLGPGG